MIQRSLWLRTQLAETGEQIVANSATTREAAEDLADKINANEPATAQAVLIHWLTGQLKVWTYKRVRDHFQEDEIPGQATLPCPELPPHLEIGIARTAHQNVMTARDWDNALAIYRNRRDQAEVSFQAVERRYNQIRPLLIDDTLTTADVIDRLPPESPQDEAADG
jgi:hypothetical protein